MIDRERGESEADKRRFDVKRYLPSALRPQDKTVRLNSSSLISMHLALPSSNHLLHYWIRDFMQ